MLASLTIREIASALAPASTATRPGVRTPTRILCLCLKTPEQVFSRAAGAKSTRRTQNIRSVAEAFLKYTPRIFFRSSAQNTTHWLFLEIASTSHLLSGEAALMASAANFARDLGFDVQCAVADTPAGAQAFATSHRDIIIAPGEESEELQKLSLPYLLALEGLEPWTRPSAVESIVTFFMMLGFKNLGDLSRFTSTSLQERWGETGALLWKRLHAQDRPMISALIPEEPLADYLHLDFPVSLASLLLREVEKSVDFLFARLQGRRCVARQLNLILHCEYSNTQHKIVLEPSSPSRDRDLFLTLLENRLGQVDLENPIRDFELLVTPGHEDSRQMDFFEPRNSDQDKLTTLMSLLTQSQLKPGLYRIEPSLTPEKSWTLGSSVEPPKQEGNREAFATQLTSGQIPATRPEPFYGAGVMQAPRPTRVLQTPRPLSLSEVARMRLLSSSPIERLENGWWETAEMRRDYYFALSPEGDCLWIFQDPRTADYFLHGYFD